MNRKALFEYVKDHVSHFGFFPADYEDRKTEKVTPYPEYMKFFSKAQTKQLSQIFNHHEEYASAGTK